MIYINYAKSQETLHLIINFENVSLLTWYLQNQTSYSSRAPGFTLPRFLVGSMLFICLVLCVMFVIVLCPVYQILPVSQNCPFWIVPFGFLKHLSKSPTNAFKGSLPEFLKFLVLEINVREYRVGNQKRTVQRNWQNRIHKTMKNIKHYVLETTMRKQTYIT